MLEQALVSGGVSLLVSAVVTFAGYWFWPAFRRWRVRRAMRVESAPFGGEGGVWCRVVNDGAFTMGGAVGYVSLTYTDADVLDTPNERKAFNPPGTPTPLREGLVCWAGYDGETNPTRVDIYAGEKRSLDIGVVLAEWVEVVSEKNRDPARVFLKRKRYTGTLKIVCADCRAKSFAFELDPDNKGEPIRFIG